MIWGRNVRTFCFRRTDFVHSRSGTYCAILLVYFGLKFLPDIRDCVYWVLAEIWAPDSSHKIWNKFFIHHSPSWKEGSFVCETVWFFSWVNTHLFDLKFVAFCPKFSGQCYAEFQEKTISGGFFKNFVQTKAILKQNLWNSPYFLQFFSGSVLRWKSSQKYFRMLFAPRWGGTSINKSQKEDTGK